MNRISAKSNPFILLAEDDPDDRLLIREALADAGFSGTMEFVGDGEELIRALVPETDSEGETKLHRVPDLVLVDLNMPKMDGRDAIRTIKSHEALRRIPLVILTTSNAPDDIRKSYELGGSSYIIKPTSFHELVRVLRSLNEYWFGTVELPDHSDSSD